MRSVTTPVLVLLALLAVPADARRPRAPALPPAPPCAGTVESSPFLGCANADNLRAMVADPQDLVRGRDSGGSDAVLEAAAIARLRADKVKPLRANSTTERSSPGASQ